jgi:hypothetical protein
LKPPSRAAADEGAEVVEATLKCYNDVAYSFSLLQTPSVWAKEKEECSDEYLEPLKMMSFGRGESLKWFL